MSKKDYNYFEAFKNQMSLCKKAAKQFMEMLEDYTDIKQKADAIHDTEHEADKALHDLMHALNRSFITPIDREDIVSLGNTLDNITDGIEDAANLFDMLSITEVKPEAKNMAALIMSGCEALYDAVVEFAHFKNSKNLNNLVIKVNQAEEAGDKAHRDIIKIMYQKETDAIQIMKWKEIFDTMEDVLDYCEYAADLIDSLVIKNS